MGHPGPVGLVIMAGIVARKQLLEVLALLLPIIILGGIYSLFTPTEAAAVAVVYSLVVAIYIYDEMNWSDMGLIADSTVMMGSLVVIMVIAFVFNDWSAIQSRTSGCAD